MKNIVLPHFFKRFLAAFMDAALCFFLFALLYYVVTPPVRNWIFHYNDLTDEIYDYRVGSHLHVVVNDTTIIEVKDYTDEVNESNRDSIRYLGDLYEGGNVDTNYVLSHLQYYFCNFLTGENIEIPAVADPNSFDIDGSHLRNKYYNETTTVGEKSGLPKDIYTVSFVKDTILEGKDYLEVAEDGILRIKEGTKVDNIKSFIKEKIDDSTLNLYSQRCYLDPYSKREILSLVSVFVSYGIAFSFVYLLFPMVLRNGMTLGKLSTGLCLVNKLGYKVTRPQVLLRFICFFVEISLFTFIIGIHWFTSMATLGVGIVALLIATLISKQKRSLHDFLAGTMVIDHNKSVFFKDANDEAMYEEDMNKHLKEYSEGPIIDAHVIQVGGKVIEKEEKETVDKE